MANLHTYVHLRTREDVRAVRQDDVAVVILGDQDAGVTVFMTDEALDELVRKLAIIRATRV